MIFEEFYRGKAAIVHEEEGTGLGLTIVKRTVGAYGGEIHVQSEVNKGTTFSAVLPAALIVPPEQEGGEASGVLRDVGETHDDPTQKAR